MPAFRSGDTGGPLAGPWAPGTQLHCLSFPPGAPPTRGAEPTYCPRYCSKSGSCAPSPASGHECAGPPHPLLPPPCSVPTSGINLQHIVRLSCEFRSCFASSSLPAPLRPQAAAPHSGMGPVFPDWWQLAAFRPGPRSPSALNWMGVLGRSSILILERGQGCCEA